jgi:hypothetical protein
MFESIIKRLDRKMYGISLDFAFKVTLFHNTKKVKIANQQRDVTLPHGAVESVTFWESSVTKGTFASWVNVIFELCLCILGSFFFFRKFQ